MSVGGKREGAGRKKGPPKHRITLYLNPDVNRGIRAEAERLGCPLSDVLEMAWRLAEGLIAQTQPAPPVAPLPTMTTAMRDVLVAWPEWRPELSSGFARGRPRPMGVPVGSHDPNQDTLGMRRSGRNAGQPYKAHNVRSIRRMVVLGYLRPNEGGTYDLTRVGIAAWHRLRLPQREQRTSERLPESCPDCGGRRIVRGVRWDTCMDCLDKKEATWCNEPTSPGCSLDAGHDGDCVA